MEVVEPPQIRGLHRRQVIVTDRCKYLAMAIWPNGFRCEACGHKREVPWMCEVPILSKSGARSICPNCRDETSLCDKRLRLLCQTTERIRIVAVVCKVFKTSIVSVIARPRAGCNPMARRAIMRELLGVMPESEIANVFGTQVRSVRGASISRPTVDIWKGALEQRDKERERHERDRAKRAYRDRIRRIQAQAEVEDPSPNR